MGNKELHPKKPSPFRNSNPDYPIVSVSYFDIELFLDKLNDLSIEYQFRLPTEAEWEYACRAGTKIPFSFGEILNDRLANYNLKIILKYTINELWTNFRDYPDALTYPLSGLFIIELIDNFGREKFIYFFGNQTYDNAKLIFGEKLDKVIEGFENKINT